MSIRKDALAFILDRIDTALGELIASSRSALNDGIEDQATPQTVLVLYTTLYRGRDIANVLKNLQLNRRIASADVDLNPFILLAGGLESYDVADAEAAMPAVVDIIHPWAFKPAENSPDTVASDESFDSAVEKASRA